MNIKPFTTIAVIAAIGLTLCFAALSAGHWWFDLKDQEPIARYGAVMASGFISIMVSASAYLSGQYGRGILVATAIFFGADSYQNMEGYQTIKAMPLADEIEMTRNQIAAAETVLQGITLPLRDCLCPQTKLADKQLYEAQRTAALDDISRIKTKLAELTQPATENGLVWLAMAGLQIALIILFALIGKPEDVPAQQASSEQPEAGKSNVRYLRPQQPPKTMDDRDRIAWKAIEKRS